jgi:S1-C subfamily serine protease
MVMKKESIFSGKTALLGLIFLAGCAVSPGPSAKYTPRPDGRYDNHPFLVDSARMDLARAMASFVTLYTHTKFEGPNGQVLESKKVGSGLILDGRYILTVEHVIAQHEYSVPTPFGMMRVPVKRKISEETSFRWKGKTYPLRTVYKNRVEDVALMEIPPGISPPSFPYRIGNSDDLNVGNFVYVIGNPLSVGINVREGIVSAIQAPKEATAVGVNPKHAFMVSNGLMPGDSGSPIIAIRDGRFELVGISQGTVTANTRLSWGIRINVIRKLLRSARAVSSDNWKTPEKAKPAAPRQRKKGGVSGLLISAMSHADRLLGALFPPGSFFRSLEAPKAE